MKKVAIVGVEGSGKTVMLAGLGDLYTYPDEQGYFLSPKNFSTAAYVAEKIERMRNGEWPTATPDDVMEGLDWTLKRSVPGERRRPETVCEISFLDFAGEVYRTAFGIGAGNKALSEQAEELKRYVREADDLIVLINLRDVIVHGARDKRVQEAAWITKAILDVAHSEKNGHKPPRAAIVLSQADSYADTIRSSGGASGILKKYLPYVYNDYNWLDVFSASAVDKTKLDDDGKTVPVNDFTTKGLVPILGWIREVEVSGGVHNKVQLWEGGPYWAETNIGAEKPWEYGYYFWWGDTIGYKWENSVWAASDGSKSDFSFGCGNAPTYGKSIGELARGGWITVKGKGWFKKDYALAPEHDAAHVHWGGEWRMPTEQELNDLSSKCDWKWTTINGVEGYIVRGRGEYVSASIFLPAAGYGDGTSLNDAGSHGDYWSSVPRSDYSYDAWRLYFDSGYHSTSSSRRRYYGQSVRPVQGFT